MAKKKKFGSSAKGPKPEIEKSSLKDRPFGKVNFIMMAVCLVMIVLGFILMSGGGSSVEGGFNPEVFSARRIIVGPTISFLGFLFMAIAIVYSPCKEKQD